MDGKLSFRLGHDWDVWSMQELDQGTHQLMSTSGIWRIWEDPDHIGHTADIKRSITRAVVQAMAKSNPVLEFIQLRWTDAQLRIDPPRQTTVNPVIIIKPRVPPMPVSASIALGWTLHGLDQWRLVAAHNLTVVLPVQPLPGARQQAVVMCPGAEDYHLLLDHAPLPHEQLVVLGTRSRVQQVISIMNRDCHYFRLGDECVLALQHGTLIRISLRDRLLELS